MLRSLRAFAFLAALLQLAPFTSAENKTITLDIRNADVSPDGFLRSAVTAGGTFPGTPILLNKGDRVNITVNNQLTDSNMRRSTSIHWHGFFQAHTSYADGPAFVNQCPIAPGDSFSYAFDTAGQTGSYWYHSHLSTQYCDGLRGAFVVYDPEDPHKELYQVDDESTIITLADWYHAFAPDAQDTYFQTKTVPTPNATLINGLGKYASDQGSYAIINVVQNKTYRFRLISLSCRPFFTFSIDNHEFKAIELDGVSHVPTNLVQKADVYAAQRVSIVMNASQPIGNYWIRALPQPANFGDSAKLLSKAILRYAGAPDEEPQTSDDPDGVKMDDTKMRPIDSEGPGKYGSGKADKTFRFNISMGPPDDPQAVAPFFEINNISYISPTVPVLLQIMSGAADPADFLPSEQVNIIEPGDIVDIELTGGGTHPFHLHGHNFDVVQTVNGINYTSAPRRDVFPLLQPNNSLITTFRFKADNPGAWFLHCHIDWHLEAGLAVVFAESPKKNLDGPDKQIIPDAWKELCPIYDDLDPDLQ
ncbi:hypothetical protein D9758_014080 [Tetrapyrgos nigripes]|uniref:Laccase n=1 Tax=Tetrapyrgos nigripes TaxID=182062 RepID=A0A8H5FLH3_9AGAR|nr:hypothetical protein D9758_014080 [Tetrapyrgos nigripes]